MSSPGYSLPEGYAPGSFWYYAPNKPAPIVFSILFTVSGIWHFYQCYRFRSWKATSMLPVAALIFVAGFVLRAIGAWHYDNLNVFIASTVMVLSAPPFYEAANFFTLGRILYYVAYQAPMHPGRVVTTFSFLQMVVEALNGTGGARVQNGTLTAQQQNVGKAMLKTALILQLICQACFITLAVAFEYRCHRAGLLPKRLRNVLRVLYLSCLLITTRTVYRTVEWFEDSVIVYTDPSTFPPLFKREWFFWFFEATLMVINTWLLNLCHPSRYLPSNLHIFLATDGVGEILGQGFRTKRNFWYSIIDPFDMWGLLPGQFKERELWLQQAREETAAHREEINGNGASNSEAKP